MLLFGAAFLQGCAITSREHKLRYRITVDIETPSGLGRGAGVLEVTIKESPPLLPGPRITFGLSGEAIPIDLPNGQTLFALVTQPLMPDAAIHLPIETFGPEMDRADPRVSGRSPDWARRTAHLTALKPLAELTGDRRPFLVRFRDLGRPDSVEAVDPDGLAAVFGAGYSLRRVTIAITDDPVSEGIARRLPWLDRLPRRYLRDTRTQSDAPIDQVDRNSFKVHR